MELLLYWKRYHFTLHCSTGIYAVSFETLLEEWTVYKFLSMLVLKGYIAHYSLVFCDTKEECQTWLKDAKISEKAAGII